MALVAVDAIILQVFPYGDTSRILRLLTRTEGLRSAIARGARRPKSRFGGVLEPFAEGSATLFLRPARDLQTLSGFELTRSRQGLGRHLLRFGAASLLAELVLRTESEHAPPATYERIARALDRIEAAVPPRLEAVALAEAWGLVAALGFAPELDACLTCGRELESEEDAAFDHPAGGVRCAPCAAGSSSRPLPAAARRALRLILRNEEVQLPRTVAYWHLLERFLFHHVGEGSVLRSLEFIAAALEETA
jgi:DNA repair protein RecO (recombination protein O)